MRDRQANVEGKEEKQSKANQSKVRQVAQLEAATEQSERERESE